MGLRERRERERHEMREAILDAAREVARREGWRAVTIRKIAEGIEYSPPMIYEHFDSKDAVLLELLRRGFAELLQRIEAAKAAALDPEAALFGVANAYWIFARQAPDLYQVMYGLGGVAFPATDTWVEGARIGAAVGEVVRDILVLRRSDRWKGKELTDLDARVTTKVTILWGTIHGLVALTMAGRIAGGDAEARRVLEQAVRNALRAWHTEE
ncbi:MAG: TetR/AcrR family transcriptional regulator [Ktedonobacterales bacterium]